MKPSVVVAVPLVVAPMNEVVMFVERIVFSKEAEGDGWCSAASAGSVVDTTGTTEAVELLAVPVLVVTATAVVAVESVPLRRTKPLITMVGSVPSVEHRSVVSTLLLADAFFGFVMLSFVVS
jgi:hypothetical protein